MCSRNEDVIPFRTSAAALPAKWRFESGHVASTDTAEGQALWQPGGDEEDSCFYAGDWYLRLMYNDDDDNEEEEEETLDEW